MREGDSLRIRRMLDGLNAEGEAPPPVLRKLARESVHVSYRLHLNSQAQAGTHPWPIALSFKPNTV